MKGDEIRTLLDGYAQDGGKFSFAEKRGINLVFEVEGMDAETACSAAKQAVKATDWGKVLYFTVQAR